MWWLKPTRLLQTGVSDSSVTEWCLYWGSVINLTARLKPRRRRWRHEWSWVQMCPWAYRCPCFVLWLRATIVMHCNCRAGEDSQLPSKNSRLKSCEAAIQGGRWAHSSPYCTKTKLSTIAGCWLPSLSPSQVIGPQLGWLLQHEHVFAFVICPSEDVSVSSSFVSMGRTYNVHVCSIRRQDASRWLAGEMQQTAGFSYWPHRWQPSWECQL